MYEGKIHLPETYWQQFFLAVVIDAGEKVDKTIKKDSFVFIEWNGKVQKMQDDIYLVDAKSVLAAKRMDQWVPIGNRIIILRDNAETISKGGIIIPEKSRDKTQSLYGVVRSLGWKDDKQIECNVKPGDYVRIKEWDVTHREFGIMGKYNLIVHNKFIICKIEK